MLKYDISIIIPSRNEMFLQRTIEDILNKRSGKTEVIAVLDGAWADPPVKDHPDVTLIHHSRSIGQRAACNEAALLSRAKYIIKCDAHCGFDKGFDVKLLEDIRDDWTMVPVMRNLWAFNWVCEDGHERYQGPSGPCTTCGKETKRDYKWIGKHNPQSDSYSFNSEPRFMYFKAYRKRPEYKEGLKIGLTETMSLQGSFFMMSRDKYWELNICDENFGSWGSQGLEVAIKTWLSGGKCMVSHKTWYAHMFRTQGGDFGFPYPQSDRKVKQNRDYARDRFINNKWNGAVRPLHWLLERFWPVPEWTEEKLNELKEINDGNQLDN